MDILIEFSANTPLYWVWRDGTTVKVVHATWAEMSAVPANEKSGPYVSEKEALLQLHKLV